MDEIWEALDVFETLFVTDTPSCPTVCRCFGRAWVHLRTNNSLSDGSVEKVTMPGRSTELCTYSRSPCLGTGRPKAAGNLLLPSAVRAFFCLKHIPAAVSVSGFDTPYESLPGVAGPFPCLRFWDQLHTSVSGGALLLLQAPSCHQRATLCCLLQTSAFSLCFQWCLLHRVSSSLVPVLQGKVRSGNGDGGHPKEHALASRVFWPF